MIINTAQIAYKARSACLNKVNIFTLLFAILLYAAISYIDYEQPILISTLWVLYSFYAIQLGLSISKPQTELRELNNHGLNIGIRVVETGQNRVNIGQSLLNVVKLIARNLLVCLLLIGIEVVTDYFIYDYTESLIVQQHQRVDVIVSKFYKKLIDSDTDPKNLKYNDVLYADFTQILTNHLEDVQKIYSLIMRILLVMIGHSMIKCFLNWLKITIFAEVEKKNDLENEADIQRRFRFNRNGIIPRVGLFHGLKMMGKTYIRFDVISAQFRLYFRFWWIILFFWFLQPYYYVCLAYFYREICPMSSTIRANIIFQKTKQSNEGQRTEQQTINKIEYNQLNQDQKSQEKLTGKTEHKQQSNTQQQVNNSSLNQSNVNESQNIFSNKQTKQQQNSIENPTKSQHVTQDANKNTKIEETSNTKQADDFKKMSRGIYQVLDHRFNHQRLHPLLSDLFKTLDRNINNLPRPKKRKQRTNEIQKLVYRPFYNDLIKVKQF